MTDPVRLNLGCGLKKMPTADGWINVDVARAAEPEFCFDIGEVDWPWDNESVGEINASHVMEHLTSEGFLHAMSEAYRVLKPGSLFTIEVPHPRSDYFIGDPTHRTPVDENVLNLFSRKLCLKSQADGHSNTPLAIYLEVDFDITHYELQLNPKWMERLHIASGSVAVSEHDSELLKHAVSTFNNVVHGMKFVLERQ